MPMPIAPGHTPKQIAESFGYDPETGAVWRTFGRATGRVIMYNVVMLEGYSYQVCRIAWCIHYGEWPPLDRYIDHINGKHWDDRPENMRLTTPRENIYNTIRNGKHSRGVRFDSRNSSNPWIARIRNYGVERHLGNFATHAEAARAYAEAAVELHGEFALDYSNIIK
jgi:hypothetical protein